MEKAKKNSQFDAKNVTSSPYFVAAVLALVIVAIIALIVYFMNGIKDTKQQIKDARTVLAQNKQSVQELDQLRARSEEAQKELSKYEGILPSSLGDAYKLQDKVFEACEDAGLTVNSFDISQVQGATFETVINLDITGNFTDIHSFLSKFAHQKQIRRIDALTITKAEGDAYNAVTTLTLLSTEGADYLATTNIIDEAVEQVVESASTDEG